MLISFPTAKRKMQVSDMLSLVWKRLERTMNPHLHCLCLAGSVPVIDGHRNAAVQARRGSNRLQSYRQELQARHGSGLICACLCDVIGTKMQFYCEFDWLQSLNVPKK